MTGTARDAEGSAARPPRVGSLLAALGPLVGLAAAWLLFALLAPETFLTWENHRLMLLLTAVVGTAAIGATLIIVAGGIDLSVGSMIALGTVVVALALERGLSPILAVAAGIGAGLLVGAAIGAIVIGHAGRVAAIALGVAAAAWSWPHLPAVPALAIGGAIAAIGAIANERLVGRIPLASFIVTLGMWGALRGAAKGLGDNQPIYPGDTWLLRLMRSAPHRDDAPAGLVGALRSVGEGYGPLVPWGVWILFALALAMAFLLRSTRFGRHVFAIGSSERAARLAGVPVERTRLLVFLIGAGCAGIAAVLQFAYLSMGDPTTAEGYELKVIAAVVIGGASLAGGEGSVRGTIIGALVMTVVDNGCTKLGLDNWVQEIVTGAIIVLAVALDRLRHRGAAARA